MHIFDTLGEWRDRRQSLQGHSIGFVPANGFARACLDGVRCLTGAIDRFDNAVKSETFPVAAETYR